jgi:hypothetical protein
MNVCTAVIIGIAVLLFTGKSGATGIDPAPHPIVFPDGSKYVGAMKDGLRHGEGRFVWPDGAEYRGGFIMGVPHGEGVHWFPDGKRRRVVHDHGRLVRASMISNAERRGNLVFGEFFRGERYTGWYRGDPVRGEVPHGRGIMRYDNGSVYTGQWKDGKMHGNGTIRWEDGSIYAGQWRAGKRTGFGTYTWPNGDRYVGGWSDNRMCGEGTYYQHDGKVTNGIWKENTVPVRE